MHGSIHVTEEFLNHVNKPILENCKQGSLN